MLSFKSRHKAVGEVKRNTPYTFRRKNAIQCLFFFCFFVVVFFFFFFLLFFFFVVVGLFFLKHLKMIFDMYISLCK